jgi:hypothetical protein
MTTCPYRAHTRRCSGPADCVFRFMPKPLGGEPLNFSGRPFSNYITFRNMKTQTYLLAGCAAAILTACAVSPPTEDRTAHATYASQPPRRPQPIFVTPEPVAPAPSSPVPVPVVAPVEATPVPKTEAAPAQPRVLIGSTRAEVEDILKGWRVRPSRRSTPNRPIVYYIQDVEIIVSYGTGRAVGAAVIDRPGAGVSPIPQARFQELVTLIGGGQPRSGDISRDSRGIREFSVGDAD